MTYRPLPDLRYLRDGDRLLLTREAAGTALTLKGQEASLWTLWAQGVDGPSALRLLCLIHDLSPRESARCAASLVDRLAQAGMVEAVGG